MRTALGGALLALTASVVALIGAAPPASTAPSTSSTAANTAGPAGRIRHVVVVYQENHSFDETLGSFCLQHRGRCNGMKNFNVLLRGGKTAKLTKSPDIVPSVYHNVAAQVAAVHGGKMDGWRRVGGCNTPGPKGQLACLTYYTPQQIPNLAALASKFVVSDRTFSMYDSPSYGSHIYVAAATQNHFTGDNPSAVRGVHGAAGWGCDSKKVAAWINPKTHQMSMQPSCIPTLPGTLNAKLFPNNGAFRPTQVPWVPTIFDRLDAKSLSWKLYSSTAVWGVCPSFAECLYGPQKANVVAPYTILDDAKNGKLPAYSVLLPIGPGGGTSQHNGSSMLKGDNWIGRALSALQRGPEWSSTAVFITYDDCGCFYDHVPPGKNPDGSRQGIRVPMVIVSPYAKVAFTDSHPASFASILKFTEETFGLPTLMVNDRQAYDYANAFNFAAASTGTRIVLRQHAVPESSRQYVAAHPRNPDADNDPG